MHCSFSPAASGATGMRTGAPSPHHAATMIPAASAKNITHAFITAPETCLDGEAYSAPLMVPSHTTQGREPVGEGRSWADMPQCGRFPVLTGPAPGARHHQSK